MRTTKKYFCELLDGGEKCVIDAKSHSDARHKLGYESYGEQTIGPYWPRIEEVVFSVQHDGQPNILSVTVVAEDRLLSVLKQTGQLGQPTIKAARELRTAREANQPAKPKTLQDRLRDRQYTVPLGADAVAWARERAEKERPRVKNWEWPRPAICTRAFQISDIDHGRYSSRCTYTHWTYQPYVQSYGTVLPSGLYYHLDRRVYHFRNPHGYEWRKDANGIKLVRLADTRDDYHPTSDDLVSDGRQATLRSLTRKLRENAATRRAAKAAQQKAARETKAKAEQEAALLRKAEREGCRVCIRDSVRAGNCAAGTETWARRHGFSPNGHYKPSEVLARANGDTSRVAIVVGVALKRHREEMRRGFCQLADHHSR